MHVGAILFQDVPLKRQRPPQGHPKSFKEHSRSSQGTPNLASNDHLGTPWGQFSTSWIPFWLRRAPRGRHWALPGRHLGPLGHPFGTLWTHLGGHFCHLGNVSPKRSKKTLCLVTFFTSFREGCTCNPSTQAQSKHTFGHYF